MAQTATGFLKEARHQLDVVDSSVANEFIDILRKDSQDELEGFLIIPYTIPAKYHDRMKRVWAAMIARVLFECSSEKISYAERFKLSQRIK